MLFSPSFSSVRLAVACAIALSLAVGCSHKSTPEPIYIGHVAPFSGAEQAHGEQEKRGIQLAVTEVDQPQNLIAGRQVSVIHPTAGSDDAALRAVFERLVTVNRVVAALGGDDLAQVENLAALAQSQGVPVVLASQPPIKPSGGYLFYTGISQAQQGKALARYASSELKSERVAIVTHADQSAVAEAFAKGIPADKIVGRWSYSAPDKWKAALDELKGKKPTAVLFAGSVADLLELSKAELDAKTPILFAGDESSRDKLKSEAYRRTIYQASVYANEDQLPKVHEFVASYQKTFGEAPDVRAALAYDDARLLFEALRKALPGDTKKFREALETIQFESLTGPLQFAPDHTALRTVFIVEWKEGKNSPVKHYEAEEK